MDSDGTLAVGGGEPCAIMVGSLGLVSDEQVTGGIVVKNLESAGVAPESVVVGSVIRLGCADVDAPITDRLTGERIALDGEGVRVDGVGRGVGHIENCPVATSNGGTGFCIEGGFVCPFEVAEVCVGVEHGFDFDDLPH